MRAGLSASNSPEKGDGGDESKDPLLRVVGELDPHLLVFLDDSLKLNEHLAQRWEGDL